MLEVAESARKEIDGLLLRLSSIDADINQLRQALKDCHRAGLAAHSLKDAEVKLLDLEKLLAQLEAATVAKDVALIEQCISDCRKRGVPLSYLNDALGVQRRVHEVTEKLARAKDSLDIEALDAAVQARAMEDLPS